MLLSWDAEGVRIGVIPESNFHVSVRKGPADRVRFSWESEVEEFFWIGDGCWFRTPRFSGSTTVTGWEMAALPHCRRESGADAILVTF